MASAAVSATTQTPKNAPQFQLAALRSHIYTMAAAFAGVVFGILGSMGFVGTYLHSQFASENAALSSKIVSMSPTADTTSMCTAPAASTTAASAPKAKTAAAVAPETASAPTVTGNQGGGKGGDGGSSAPAPFVSQMVNGTISDTGPGSHNSISGTNSYSSTTTNNNNVSVSNNNNQSANSGSASSDHNTTAGSTTTGDVQNQHSANTSISINN